MMGFPVPTAAVLALVAFAAGAGVGGYATRYVMTSSQNAKELAIYREGQRRIETVQGIADDYNQEITDLRKRKPKRVPNCPDLPAGSPSGTSAPDSSVDHRRDDGPLLRAALDELIRCQKWYEATRKGKK